VCDRDKRPIGSRGDGRVAQEYPVSLVISLDKAVLLGAVVAVRSALENLSSGSQPRIYVFHDGLSTADQDGMLLSWTDDSLINSEPTVKFIVVGADRFRHLIRSKIVSRMAYSLLIMADQLPSVDRALYLDTDCIVRTDLRRLFQVQLGSDLAAGVPDGPRAHGEAQLQRLGLETDLEYYNTGVVLADLAAWRESKVGEAAVRFAVDRRPTMHDQDALNAVLAGKWRTLPESWNMWASRLSGSAADFEGIIHCTGVPKPWHVDYQGPVESVFYDVISRTTFQSQMPSNWLGIARPLTKIRRRLPYLPTVWRILKNSFTR
jgi:lipopolysaccharide biosynthesis glycosyltransferase